MVHRTPCIRPNPNINNIGLIKSDIKLTNARALRLFLNITEEGRTYKIAMIIIMICLSILIFPLKQIFLLLSIELGIMNSCYECSPNHRSKENCCNDSNASRIIHFIYRIIFAISEEVITGGRISLKICKIIRIKIGRF